MPVPKINPVTTTDPFLTLAKDAYDASTDYIEQNLRKEWDMSIKAFHNEHPSGSKYHHSSYKYRSKLFRPKTRATIRRSEAAAAAAFFGSQDLVEIEPANQNSPISRAAAEVSHYLLNHRLENTIPWFQTCIGAIQDAATVGACVSFQHWKYLRDANGKVIADKPEILLRPIENIRFDAAAEWTDPVNTSPYFIDLIPLFIKDVLSMMNTTDLKTGSPRWKRYTEAEIQATQENIYDSTRTARNKGKQDPNDKNDGFRSFDVVYVHRNIIRENGQDFFYYTLGTDKLLTEPVWLEDVYHHGERPYVMGQIILETHKTHPSGIPSISKDVQKEANEINNARLDNVKLVLNKRYFVKRGREVDLASLVRNAAGSATLMTDVDGDVRVVDTPDVTSSSYAEQSRIDLDFDDLVGNFSPSTIQSNRSMNETVGGLNILKGEAGAMTGYMLKTFAETWLQPVIRQLVKLEHEYENDMTLLATASNQSEAIQKHGLNPTMDELMSENLLVTANVGMTATDPGARLQQLIVTVQAFVEIAASGSGLDMRALADEMFGKIGYRDSSRFWPTDSPDPEVVQLQQMIQQLQQEAQSQQAKIQAENQGKLELAHLESETTQQIKAAELEYKERSDELDARMDELDASTKIMVAKIQAQAQQAVANTTSKDKSKDRLANRLGKTEDDTRADKDSEGARTMERGKAQDTGTIKKISDGVSTLMENEKSREKDRSTILKFIQKNGSDKVKAVAEKIGPK